MDDDGTSEKNVTNNNNFEREYVPPSIPVETEFGLRLSALNPKYLHTNSTSHTWPFSAVAELVDNAYDPDVKASLLHIDLESISRGHQCELTMTFTDNGSGMSPDKLYKMLSFGFCEKVAIKGHTPVGHYGNGFKSGSMRIGKDALVFTKNAKNRSVGFLSQTYLSAVNADTIIVPMITWDNESETIIRSEEERCSLPAILKYSVIESLEKINEQFSCIKSESGTRIIISKLRRTAGKLEFDVTSDKYDVKIPEDIADSEEGRYKREERQHHIPASDYSLRAYLSILYLKPKMQIYLRTKKVKTVVIQKSLSKTEVDVYRPTNEKPMKIVFGFSENINHYGIMMYHCNRLIKPYIRVGCQLKANNMGVGVIGVIECNSLQPTHNKQDFDYTPLFRATMNALGCKLNDYWNEKTNGAQVTGQFSEVTSLPDELWVQCDITKCLKWRKLPDWVKKVDLPDKWFCRMHPDPVWADCSIPEEEEESQALVTPYEKKLKKRARQLKEMERLKNARKKQVEQDMEKIEREREAMKLRQQQEEIARLRQQLSSEPSKLIERLTEPSRNLANSLPTMKSLPHHTSQQHDMTPTVVSVRNRGISTQHARVSQTRTRITNQNPLITPHRGRINLPLPQITSSSQNAISDCSPVVNGDGPIVSEVFSIQNSTMLQKTIKEESNVYGSERLYPHSADNTIGSRKRPISLDSEDEEDSLQNKLFKNENEDIPDCIDLENYPEHQIAPMELKPDPESLCSETDTKPEGISKDTEAASNDISTETLSSIDRDITESFIGLDSSAIAILAGERTQALRNLRKKIYAVSKILFPDVGLPEINSSSMDDLSIEDFLDGIIDAHKPTEIVDVDKS